MPLFLKGFLKHFFKKKSESSFIYASSFCFELNLKMQMFGQYFVWCKNALSLFSSTNHMTINGIKCHIPSSKHVQILT